MPPSFSSEGDRATIALNAQISQSTFEQPTTLERPMRRVLTTGALASVLALMLAMTPIETAMAGEAMASSNPRSGDPAAIESGRKLYVKWCLQCHGSKGDGTSTRFGKYAADLRKFWRGYSQFVAIVVQGRPKKRMPPWAGVLTGEEIEAIGAFLETLAIDGAKWTD